MKYSRRKKEEKDILQKFTGSRVGSILFLILSGILIYNIVKSIVITSEKLEILNQAEQEVSELRLENLELIVSTEYMTSDEYLETEARNRLNLSKKGETAFVIPEEMLERGKILVENILKDEEGTGRAENWKIWRDFFIVGI
jgi:cell division protein FtsB